MLPSYLYLFGACYHCEHKHSWNEQYQGQQNKDGYHTQCSVTGILEACHCPVQVPVLGGAYTYTHDTERHVMDSLKLPLLRLHLVCTDTGGDSSKCGPEEHRVAAPDSTPHAKHTHDHHVTLCMGKKSVLIWYDNGL